MNLVLSSSPGGSGRGGGRAVGHRALGQLAHEAHALGAVGVRLEGIAGFEHRRGLGPHREDGAGLGRGGFVGVGGRRAAKIPGQVEALGRVGLVYLIEQLQGPVGLRGIEGGAPQQHVAQRVSLLFVLALVVVAAQGHAQGQRFQL